LKATYSRAGLEVPKLSEAISASAVQAGVAPAEATKLLRMIVNSGELVKIDEELYFSRDALSDLVQKVRKRATQTAGRDIDVAAFKDIAGVSRKYAIPLLEYFDSERITARAGDKRVVL
jgi:selenocysteine-specific elongation factor